MRTSESGCVQRLPARALLCARVIDQRTTTMDDGQYLGYDDAAGSGILSGGYDGEGTAQNSSDGYRRGGGGRSRTVYVAAAVVCCLLLLSSSSVAGVVYYRGSSSRGDVADIDSSAATRLALPPSSNPSAPVPTNVVAPGPEAAGTAIDGGMDPRYPDHSASALAASVAMEPLSRPGEVPDSTGRLARRGACAGRAAAPSATWVVESGRCSRPGSVAIRDAATAGYVTTTGGGRVAVARFSDPHSCWRPINLACAGPSHENLSSVADPTEFLTHDDATGMLETRPLPSACAVACHGRSSSSSNSSAGGGASPPAARFCWRTTPPAGLD